MGRLRRAVRCVVDAEASHTSARPRRTRSFARDVVLATQDADRRRAWNHPLAKPVVPGALLLELVHEVRIGVEGQGRAATLVVRDPTPLGDADLDDALLVVGAAPLGRTMQRLAPLLPSYVEVDWRLLRDGLLVEETRRLLEVVTLRRRRPTDVADERTTLLVWLLDTGVSVRRWVARQERREAERRAAALLDRVTDDERRVLDLARVLAS